MIPLDLIRDSYVKRHIHNPHHDKIQISMRKCVHVHHSHHFLSVVVAVDSLLTFLDPLHISIAMRD
jgi:hypothetical protein